MCCPAGEWKWLIHGTWYTITSGSTAYSSQTQPADLVFPQLLENYQNVRRSLLWKVLESISESAGGELHTWGVFEGTVCCQAALGQTVLDFAAGWFSSRHEALGKHATEHPAPPQNLIYVSDVLFPIFHSQIVFRILDLFYPAAGELFLHVDFHFDQHSLPTSFLSFLLWSFELHLHTFASGSFAAAAYQ